VHRALFLAFLTACAASSDVRTPIVVPPTPTRVEAVHVDAAFDTPDQGEITGACTMWNEALGGVVVLEPRVHELTLFEAGVLVMRIDSSASYIPKSTRGRALAFTEHVGGRLVWLVRDRMTAEQVGPVMLHELGHVFGAQDRDGPGLMHWSFDRSEYVGVDDVTRVEVFSWLANASPAWSASWAK
jgi:hypothetical protein